MKKFGLGLSLCVFTQQIIGFTGYAELRNRRFNEVCFAHTHNGTAKGPSVVNNQFLTLPQQMERGVRSTKIAMHYKKDFGGGVGQEPTVCHGIYRSVLYTDYFGAVMGGLLSVMNDFAQKVQPYLGPIKSIPIPGAFVTVGEVPDMIKMYLEQLKPVADLVQNALPIVYGKDGVPDSAKVPFNPCVIDVAAQPITSVLADIKQFLDKNRNEVFRLTIERKISFEDIDKAFKQVGLDSYTHVQDKAKLWPTLQEMIDSNKRLVVFSASSPADYPWIHAGSDYYYETDYGFSSISALENNLKVLDSKPFQDRFKEPRNKLFEISHYLQIGLGGTAGGARKVNKYDVLRKRVKALMDYAGAPVNLLNVDFVELPDGDVFDVVDEVNGVGKFKGKPLMTAKGDTSIIGKVAEKAAEVGKKVETTVKEAAGSVVKKAGEVGKKVEEAGSKVKEAGSKLWGKFKKATGG